MKMNAAKMREYAGLEKLADNGDTENNLYIDVILKHTNVETKDPISFLKHEFMEGTLFLLNGNES